MSPEQRFVLAIVLMLIVLVGGNLLMSPPEPLPGEADVATVPGAVEQPGGTPVPAPDVTSEMGPDVVLPGPQGRAGTETSAGGMGLPGLVSAPAAPSSRPVVVEGPLYRATFSSMGGRVTSLELLDHASFTRDGPVELVQAGDPGLLGMRIARVEGDTADLRAVPLEVDPPDGLRLEAGGERRSLTFRYRNPEGAIAYEVAYLFDPASHLIEVRGTVAGVQRGVVITDLGRGIALNEVDEGIELREMAYVSNHLQGGVRTRRLSGVSETESVDGPFLWAASKSRYFVVAMLPGVEPGGEDYLGGLTAIPQTERESSAQLMVSQSLRGSGTFDFRLYAGPQDYAALSAIGNDLQEVSPVGYRWLRPVLRPIAAAIIWVLTFFHQTLSIGYGWVLILVGVLMRIILFPLHHKAMRAQLTNYAVQPLLKEIQTKYKDQPEKMQKELMRLYKEHGFNPLSSCWPLLLPWPILIALFFVFRNTIEFRGVAFWWLPDLSATDPIFVLPVLLGVSMFTMQFISMRAVPGDNPQMKMMLWFMPIFMVFLFSNFPSGLNLYYLTGNLATLPQTWWIAKEREKVKAAGPPVPTKS